MYHGQGKCYRQDGTLEYDGQLENNMRNRQGKYNRCYVTLLYEGQWENNMRNGLGKSYYKNNNVYYSHGHFHINKSLIMNENEFLLGST
jgi:hypothetical protein